tara:strand:- start:1510 stop:2040 length:531 start_codon:yes stop_codon:yes gene_type:complete
MNKDIVYVNVEKEIKDYYLDLLIECIEQRPKVDVHNNFLLNTDYLHNIYNVFISECRKKLNPFTISSLDFKCYCCLSDVNTYDTNIHNHENDGQITGILYLKVPDPAKNKIELIPEKGFKTYFYPKNFDFLILPSTLNHMPHPSINKQKRISLNLNLRCKESSKEIFDTARYGSNR